VAAKSAVLVPDSAATLKKLTDSLRKMGDKRPTKPASLWRSLKSFLGAGATEEAVEVALARLIDAGVVKVDSVKGASYPMFDAAAGSTACEGLRKVANLLPEPVAAEPNSQKFAGRRNVPDAAQGQYWRGSSQDSQLSQGFPLPNAAERPYRLTKAEGDAAHAEPWDDAACARFAARVGLFLRRGIDATDADDLAERLHLRDVQGDDRGMCLECSRLDRRGRCLAAAAGEVLGVGKLLEPVQTILLRCEAFELHKGLT